MTELLTAAQMRTIEQAAIESGEVTGFDLMERAGQGVVDAILEEWPAYKSAPQSCDVLCGPGNNGGDGFVVARLLKKRGWSVRVLAFGDPENLPPDARTNYDIWVSENFVEPLTQSVLRAGSASLIVDAIFGTGLSRPPSGELADLLRYLAGSGGDHSFFPEALVAVDIPSGLCADSGKVLGISDPDPLHSTAPYARLTVTFDSPKTGHYLGHGPHHCGNLVVKDIGISKFRETEIHPKLNRPVVRRPPVSLNWSRPDVADKRHFVSQSNAPEIKMEGHKFNHGSAIVFCGEMAQTGAARLAARGALRVGAGLVTIASPMSALAENAAQVTSIMVREADASSQAEEILSDPRIRSVCIGPGFGIDRAKAFVPIVLSSQSRQSNPYAVVLDADALSAFAQNPDDLFEMLDDSCVLTPHSGEFARLFPDIAAKLASPTSSYSKCDAAREAALRAGCTIVLKGADTVIADTLGRVAVNSASYDKAAPWLATAGAGDVLAGFITGLAARGYPVFAAASSAAHLHLECAISFGPGLIAEDLPEDLPKVFRKLSL